MDAMLFPDEALDVLREARYDPGALRGWAEKASTFHWTDELLSAVSPICAKHGSRADFYLVAYRTSLILGQPIEEYRGPWDQLRRECPEWPGFRPERSSPELARPLARDRKLALLLPGPSPRGLLMLVLFVFAAFAMMFTLPIGVQITFKHVAPDRRNVWLWIGLGMMLAGIVSLEAMWRALEFYCRQAVEFEARTGRKLAGFSRGEVLYFKASTVLGQPFFTLFLFRMLMDGGVRFRTAYWLFLAYLLGLVVMLLVRWKALTNVEVVLMRWSWAPLLAFGVPLLMPKMITLGLVRWLS
jgi:hypothetical protein